MVEVEATEEFEVWFLALAEKEAESVARVVGLLEEKGVALGFPYTSGIKGSQALRELRVQSGERAVRVFYVFDQLRRAVLLLGGIRRGTTGSIKQGLLQIVWMIFQGWVAESARAPGFPDFSWDRKLGTNQ